MFRALLSIIGLDFGDKYLENGVLIDVRSQREWNYKHIDGAILIPYYEIENKIKYYVPDINTPINVHCASGARATKAKLTLVKMGYKHVSNLGGYNSAEEAHKAHKQKKS